MCRSGTDAEPEALSEALRQPLLEVFPPALLGGPSAGGAVLSAERHAMLGQIVRAK